jgi:ribosomal protein S27AE
MRKKEKENKERICPECGTTFKYSHKNQKYCSEKCYQVVCRRASASCRPRLKELRLKQKERMGELKDEKLPENVQIELIIKSILRMHF